MLPAADRCVFGSRQPDSATHAERSRGRTATGYCSRRCRRGTPQGLARILVVPGDLSRPYRILGPVRPDYSIQSGTCSVDALRQAALDEYKHVDAIIGANISRPDERPVRRVTVRRNRGGVHHSR